MTANEKRAVALLKTLGLVADDGVYLRWMEAAIIVFEQEAERRGEELVLRWLRGFWKDPGSELGKHVVGEYRKARRARGGKR